MITDAQIELMQIPGVGKSISNDLTNIGIYSINDLKGGILNIFMKNQIK